MPTFDPNVPQPLDELDANVVRNQFNALKALIDDQVAAIAALTLRVAALENPAAGRIASGFGIAGVNGVLTDMGLFGAEHYYSTPGGYYFIFSFGDNLWVVTNAPPGQTSPFFYTKAPGSVTGTYTANAGTPPGGTVS